MVEQMFYLTPSELSPSSGEEDMQDEVAGEVRERGRLETARAIIGVMETTSAAVVLGPCAKNVNRGPMAEAEQHGDQKVRGVQDSEGSMTVGAVAYEVTKPREHGHDEKRQQGLDSGVALVCELRHDEELKRESVEGDEKAVRAEDEADGNGRSNFCTEQVAAQDR